MRPSTGGVQDGRNFKFLGFSVQIIHIGRISCDIQSEVFSQQLKLMEAASSILSTFSRISFC